VKPVLFVTGHAPPDRVRAFSLLHEHEGVEFALFGGPLAHGPGRAPSAPSASGARPGFAGGEPDLPFPHRHVSQGEVLRLAGSRRYRAVVCGTSGRLALPAAWRGARVARVPLLLWTALWAHPRSLAHAASYVGLRRLYRSADAVVTYGPHVSAYVRARGARNVHVAPQAVDNAFWSAPADPPADTPWPAGTGVKFLFVGRPVREKGIGVLLPAWRASGLAAPAAALVLVGVGSIPPWVSAGGAVALSDQETSGPARGKPSVRAVGPLDAVQLRNFYGSSDVLVMPSIPTRTFREPWGLVANEAMNQRVPVIASSAVGAAAGGLVRHERNGLVVPAGDPDALTAALRRMSADDALRTRLGTAAAADVTAFTQEAWAQGFSAALRSVGASLADAR
jgi:glycosyltransferase involved in cell wall biosynthesis